MQFIGWQKLYNILYGHLLIFLDAIADVADVVLQVSYALLIDYLFAWEDGDFVWSGVVSSAICGVDISVMAWLIMRVLFLCNCELLFKRK